ncbi:orotidine 5'-phosphate decarboxylase [Candidatus Woesearchaeota archaeon]|nr:MAG: orotidine 5'-phosphate decarboxylase [Candidatus Woesearchaeota archaeon]
MNFIEKYKKAVKEKNSILCLGLDPKIKESSLMRIREEKAEFIFEMISKLHEYCSAIKINRQFVLDLTPADLKQLTDYAKEKGLVCIADHKLSDIGNTNFAALETIQKEGFDALTILPFPGNTEETSRKAHELGLGVIVLALMSNPEYEQIKNSSVGSEPMFVYCAKQAAQFADAVVIGAPSEKNHLSMDEVKKVKEIIGDRLVLMPGVGAQGGEAEEMIKTFGENLIINVGRGIIQDQNPVEAAKKYNEMFNKLRK